MPTTDPTFGWPLPEDTDPIKDGAAAIRALAAAIAADLPHVQTGTVTVQITNNSVGSGTAVFDAPFAAEPMVALSGPTDTNYIVAVNVAGAGLTPTQVTVNARHRAATTQTVTLTVGYIAIGRPA